MTIDKRWLVAAFLFGCGSADSTSTTMADAAAELAPDSGLPSIDDGPAQHGVRYDESAGCLDTTDEVRLGTNGEPLGGGYYCLERKSDGAVYWAATIDALVFDEQEWGRCTPDLSTLPPAPCFAVHCEAAPRSLCSMASTNMQFDCGGRSSAWDEECCLRETCESTADCVNGQVCTSIPTRASWDCWPTGQDECDCGGTRGGPMRSFCIPSEEAAEQ